MSELLDPAHFDALDDGYEPAAYEALTTDRPRRQARFLDAAAIDIHPPPMLIRGWMPRGAITIVAGAPGAGKGVVMADLIARGSRGEPMPNGDKLARPFRTVIVAGPGEDSAQDWKLRLVAAGADLTSCKVVEDTEDEAGLIYPIGAPDLAAILDRAAMEGFDLLVVDSLGAVAGSLDINRNEVRELLNPLANQAHRLGLSVALIAHDRKGRGDPLDIISGSRQIVAAARAALVIAAEPNEDGNGDRLLMVAKLNGARKSDPVAFTTTGRTITDDTGTEIRDDRGDLVYIPAVAWLDRKVTNADAVAAAAGLPSTRQDGALGVLTEILANGPVRSTEVETDMKAQGYSKDQTMRARHHLGINVVKVRGCWWTLPAGTDQLMGKMTVAEILSA